MLKKPFVFNAIVCINSLSLERKFRHEVVFRNFCCKRQMHVTQFSTFSILLVFILLSIECFCLLAYDMSSHSYKNAILSSSPSLGGNTTNLCFDGSSSPNEGIMPNVSDPLADLYPPNVASFPEVVVSDELDQVKKDTVELSKSCFVGKILGAPIDIRTIMLKTKADWKKR